MFGMPMQVVLEHGKHGMEPQVILQMVYLPFQGFMVQTQSSGSPSVVFPTSAKSTGGTFYGKTSKSTISHLRLEVAAAEVVNSAWIQFSENGSVADVVHGDALELHPLASKYALLGFLKGDEVLDIAHLHHEQEVTLPIEFTTTEGGTFTLQATDFEIPEDMEVTFHDYEQGVSIVMDTSFAYRFEVAKMKQQPTPVLSVLTAVEMKTTTSTPSSRFGLTIRSASSNSTPSETPLVFELDQNYPNPFNPSTTINYSIEEAGAVTISVYNVMGQKVATLVDEMKTAGNHSVRWNAASHASGMYYYRLEANGKAMTRTMMLIK